MSLRLIAVFGVLVLVLSACAESDGGDTGDDASPSDTTTQTSTELEGDLFNLIAMAHSSPTTPQGWDVPIETSPWDGESTGTFSYSSIACADDAPINNVSTNLTTFNSRLPESRSPASTRLQPIEFEVTEEVEGGTGQFDGRIDLVACQLRAGVTPEDDTTDDEQRDSITFEFEADFERTASEEVRYTGTFTITEGTGEYEGISGEGHIGGYLMCLGPDDCADFGEFRDVQVAMIGSYDHPNLDDLREEDPSFDDTAPDDAGTESPSPDDEGAGGADPAEDDAGADVDPSPSPTGSPADEEEGI